ncbi:MAG: hypothetical protein K2X97_11115 [Mycobacteriaceae bacterium]|nr:hypothetical protein [Mycobacteriaceae bacterium]
MVEPNTNPLLEPPAKGFPFVTVAASLATLFAFLGLMVLAYNSPNYLSETKTEPKPDPAVKLAEVKARNQTLLDGKDGAKMPVSAATAELLGKLKTEKDRLPFPAPAPPQPPAPEPKKM